MCEIFAGMEVKPHYLDREFTIGLDQALLDFDCRKNKVAVVKSPNFPAAGKGLISQRSQPITKNTGLPYWGTVFIHDFKYKSIDQLNLDSKVRERLVLLHFQPFIHLGIRVYILASQSCASSYSNDATFKGWNKSPKSNPNIKNNCNLWCSEPIDGETLQGFVKLVEKLSSMGRGTDNDQIWRRNANRLWIVDIDIKT